MLENLSALAIVPKAKAIAARRLSPEEYRSLTRKRSVIEVMAVLQAHPYFKESLAGISQTNIHRQQLEEALSRDVFFKYASLMRYTMRRDGFGTYFLVRSEINELEAKLRLLSMNIGERYITRLPGFLAASARIDLLKLAAATTPQQCMAVVAGTPYAKALAPCMPRAGEPLDYLLCEHALETYFYEFVLHCLEKELSPSRRKQLRPLFVAMAESYNLDLIYRAKAFFFESLPPERLQTLLLPVYGVLPEKALRSLARARDLDEFLLLYHASRATGVYGRRSAVPSQAESVEKQQLIYTQALHLLHTTATPAAALAAVLTMAELERSNVINIIEGVRYGLAPDKIESFLKF